MKLNMIVAIARDGAIGNKGDLLWHIGDDLKRFKSLTMGHPVIMGRKTWESLPKKPLPGRRNIVISRNPDLKITGADVYSSPEEALASLEGEIPFIMGGSAIYNVFMPYVSTIFLTEVEADYPEADTRLFLADSDWSVAEEGDWRITDDGLRYRYVTLIRNEND